MKIFCIGRNYAAHAKELKNAVPTKPMVFMKPDTALLQKNRPFFYPEFSNDIHYEVELVLKIKKVGKYIEPKYALDFIEGIGLGIDFTARDIQQKCKEKGHPWEIAKAFDGSAVLGDTIIPFSEWQGKDIPFSLEKNGETVQSGNSNDMIFGFAELISHVSKFFTLKIGDLIYTGTPQGVGPIQINDHLKGYIDGQLMFETRVK